VAAATPDEPTAKGSWWDTSCLPGVALRAPWPWLLASCRSSYAFGAPPWSLATALTLGTCIAFTCLGPTGYAIGLLIACGQTTGTRTALDPLEAYTPGLAGQPCPIVALQLVSKEA
jgi:hypothetical protein